MPAPHRVVVPLTSNVPIFEVAVACEVFGRPRRDFPVPRYDVVLCRGEDGPVRTAEGLSMDGRAGLEELTRADTVIVPACTDLQGDPPTELLDDELTERWPAVRLDPNVVYTQDDGIFTSAGECAGLDLCLHLIRLDHGARVANALARRMVLPPHRDGGQSQYIDQPVHAGESTDLGPVLDWARSELHRPTTPASALPSDAASVQRRACAPTSPASARSARAATDRVSAPTPWPELAPPTRNIGADAVHECSLGWVVWRRRDRWSRSDTL